MLNCSAYVCPECRYTYALVNLATGEAHACSCDHASYAVAHLYRIMMHNLREARHHGWNADLHLVNARTGEVLLSCAN